MSLRLRQSVPGVPEAEAWDSRKNISRENDTQTGISKKTKEEKRVVLADVLLMKLLGVS